MQRKASAKACLETLQKFMIARVLASNCFSKSILEIFRNSLGGVPYRPSVSYWASLRTFIFFFVNVLLTDVYKYLTSLSPELMNELFYLRRNLYNLRSLNSLPWITHAKKYVKFWCLLCKSTTANTALWGERLSTTTTS